MELATAAVVSTASIHPGRSHFSNPRVASWSSSSSPSSSRSLSTSASTSRSQRRRLPVASAAVELREAAAGGGDSVRVIETPQPNSSVKFSVEVPPSICQECYQTTLLEYSKRFKVPGFRPGKIVPENVLLNYVGPQHVRAATVEAILRHTLPQALSSVEERALEDSVRILTKFDDMNEAFSLDHVFRYDVAVDVVPEVRWLSEDKYKNLKVVIEIDEIVDAEKAAELELKRRRKSLGLLRIVPDRGLQVGDLVVLDILAETITTDGSKGEKIPSAESTGFHLDTEENTNLVPGFLGSLIGIRPGETRTFPIQFPESFEQETLQGVRAQFTGCL
uniref:peptidylprolyl isomerase n=1 Tax=Aegilops tauschii subsp. strangulata TaxID=200361 RepID=A0A453RE33_AEGTS